MSCRSVILNEFPADNGRTYDCSEDHDSGWLSGVFWVQSLWKSAKAPDGLHEHQARVPMEFVRARNLGVHDWPIFWIAGFIWNINVRKPRVSIPSQDCKNVFKRGFVWVARIERAVLCALMLTLAIAFLTGLQRLDWN